MLFKEAVIIKDFKLDSNGDVVLYNGKIPMVCDEEYIIQTVKQILQTQSGEWLYDEEEGIDHSSMLGKDFNEEEVKDNILLGLLQIDDSFEIIDFECTQNKLTRKLNVKFSAQYGEDNRIDIEL